LLKLYSFGWKLIVLLYVIYTCPHSSIHNHMRRLFPRQFDLRRSNIRFFKPRTAVIIRFFRHFDLIYPRNSDMWHHVRWVHNRCSFTFLEQISTNTVYCPGVAFKTWLLLFIKSAKFTI
jgi:hypothetical protein